MKARSQCKNPSRRNKTAAIATNLTLSPDARRMAEQLQGQMRRPSISNVVETLILEKADSLGLKLQEAGK